jgi:hypothetical protein
MTVSVRLATYRQIIGEHNYEEKSGRGLIYGTASTFAWRNEGKPRKTLMKAVGNQTAVRTRHLPNTSQRIIPSTKFWGYC